MDEYQDPEKLDEQMKAGLARMYADNDIRRYLLHALNLYNHNVLVSTRAGKPELARDYTAKFDTMKKLIDNGKLMYSQAEKLRSRTLEEQIKDKDKQV